MMKHFLAAILFIVTTQSWAKIHWFEAKDEMSCNVSDPTISRVSDYLLKEKMGTALSELMKTLKIKYLPDSFDIDNNWDWSDATDLRTFKFSGTVLTKKNSLLALTDKDNTSEQSELSYQRRTREVETFEYDSEGIPTLRVWTCTVELNSNDLIIRLLNQTYNDYKVGSMKVKLREVFKFERVEKL